MFFLPSSASALWRLFLPLRCSCPGHSLELFNLFSTQAAGCLAACMLSDSSTGCCHAALSAAAATQPTLLKQDKKRLTASLGLTLQHQRRQHRTVSVSQATPRVSLNNLLNAIAGVVALTATHFACRRRSVTSLITVLLLWAR